MIKDDKKILEYIKNTINENGNVTVDNLRETLNIGYRRAKRMLEFLVKQDQILRVKGKGFIRSDSFKLKVTEDEVKNYNENRENIIDQNWVANMGRQNKALQDSNTRLRRLLSNSDRDHNKVDAILNGILDNITIINNDYKPTHGVMNKDKVAIVQLSDIHFNECVRPETVKGTNKYDWDVASKRLQKYAWEVKRYLEFENIDQVIVALTGDMFNSPRRYDEIVDNQDSQTIALLTGCDLITNFITDIADKQRVINVYSVFGNESRLKNDITSVHFEDSFDYLLHKIIEMKFSATDNIHFEEPTLDHSLVIRDILGANVLLIHGHNRTTFSKELEKYAKNPILSERVVIDYLLWGHVHQTKLDDRSRRSASLVGNNGYSYHRLGLQGSAEQNLHIMSREVVGRLPVMQTITINLDYTGNIPGYDMNRDKLYRKDNGPKVVQFDTL